MIKRGSGLLLHISSLPSPYGIGDFGPSAYQFVDFLEETNQRYWQLLPLNPTNTFYGNSPYSSHSAFACNVLFISPAILVEEGWLDPVDIEDVPVFPVSKVDFDAVSAYKTQLLRKTFDQFKSNGQNCSEFKSFCQKNNEWLDDYSLFVLFKEHYKEKGWNEWPKPIKNREVSALDEFRKSNADQIDFIKFLQFVVFKQWLSLRNYCLEKKVQLIGDIPIYVNFDSADVWAHPELFKLDQRGKPIVVAGVPPDYFSETGQRWGNPVYDWGALKEKGYDWWLKRIDHNLSLFDFVRIDHFRGLIDYWEIPEKEKTAVHGHWSRGPGDEFFHLLREKFPGLPIIAEDLGIITQEITDTMNRFEFPGMKVLLFAFSGDLSTHPYIPDNFGENCVAYTGTHDNNTIKGWLANDASHEEKENLGQYLNCNIGDDDIHWKLVDVTLRSRANLAIIPLQDVLGLDGDSRMNTPGSINGNWQWRYVADMLSGSIIQRLNQSVVDSNR